MLSTDRKEFDHHIDVLMSAFDRNPTPEKREAYWLGLNDCRLSEIVANVAKLCKLARKGQPPPKPSELRNVLPQGEYQAKDPKAETEIEAAKIRNKHSWEDFHREDPELAAIELRIAVAGRILARDHEGSPQFAEALSEERRSRDDRVRVWRERAAKNSPPKDWKR